MNKEEIRNQFEKNLIKDSQDNGDTESCTNALIQRHKNGKYIYAWQEEKPIATLILGGIDCGEYTEIDIDFIDLKAAESLQEKLVKNSDSVRIPLYIKQEHIEPAQSKGFSIGEYTQEEMNKRETAQSKGE
jgi:hypothetical protein